MHTDLPSLGCSHFSSSHPSIVSGTHIVDFDDRSNVSRSRILTIVLIMAFPLPAVDYSRDPCPYEQSVEGHTHNPLIIEASDIPTVVFDTREVGYILLDKLEDLFLMTFPITTKLLSQHSVLVLRSNLPLKGYGR